MNDIKETIQLIKKYTGLTNINEQSFYSKDRFIKCVEIISAYHNFRERAFMLNYDNVKLQARCVNVKGKTIQNDITIYEDIFSNIIYDIRIVIKDIHGEFVIPTKFVNVVIPSITLTELIDKNIKENNRSIIVINSIDNLIFNMRKNEEFLGLIYRNIIWQYIIIKDNEVFKKLLKQIAIIYNTKYYNNNLTFFIELCIKYVKQFINDEFIFERLVIIQEKFRDYGNTFDNWIKNNGLTNEIREYIKSNKETTGTRILKNVISTYNKSEIHDCAYNICMITILDIIGVWDEK